MKRVEFTDQEINVLGTLLDAAVRQLGLQAAEAAAVISRKLQQAEDVKVESEEL